MLTTATNRPSSETPKFAHQPHIDGLRAVSVLAVVLFHFNEDILPGGFLGVDIFFVISGYLITNIILLDIESGSFSLSNFWTKRVKRLVPMMLLVVSCTLALVLLREMPSERKPLLTQAFTSLCSYSNVHFFNDVGDYWSKAATSSPFLHTWSLAVEEQFYFAYPILLLLIYRVSKRLVAPVILSLTILSFCFHSFYFEVNPQAAFYLMPLRIWELGSGALLSQLRTTRVKNSFQEQLFFGISITTILWCFFNVNLNAFSSGIIVLSAANTIYFGTTGLGKKLLTRPLMVYTGKLSYAIYLWHWPVLIYAPSLGLNWDGPTDKILTLLLIFLLAEASSRLVETPIRYAKRSLAPILVTWITLTLTANYLSRQPEFYNTSEYARVTQYNYNCLYIKSVNEGIRRNRGNDLILPHPNHTQDDWCNAGIVVKGGGQHPAIVVLGDSHAEMWSSCIESVAKKYNCTISFFCLSGVPGFFDIPPAMDTSTDFAGSRKDMTSEDKLVFDITRLNSLISWRPQVVIIAEKWDLWENDPNPLLSQLRTLGCKVLLIEDPPVLTCGEVNVTQWLKWRGVNPIPAGDHYEPHLSSSKCRDLVRSYAHRYDNIEIVETYDLFASPQGALVMEGNKVLYRDDDHVNIHGAKKIYQRLEDSISRSIRETIQTDGDKPEEVSDTR